MTAIIDLRSDTVTQPTEEMRLAMHQAEVGDDGRVGSDGAYGDPTVNALQALAARMLGKEDALLMASGTMANLVALMTHCSRGDGVITGQSAHIYRAEKGAFLEELYGLRPLLVNERRGVPVLSEVRRHLETGQARLLCLENTHNTAGGTAMGPEETEALAEAARARDVMVHLDGARLFNAAAAIGAEARDLAAPADSVQFCLSKGLSAPIGSVLVGSAVFIRRARERRKLIGGQMRQAGVVAAAGLVALRTMVNRLSDDHYTARRLAERLAGAPGLGVDLVSVQTNIVKVDVGGTGLTAQEFQREVAPLGLLVHIATPREIRLVTHKDVSLNDVLRAAEILVDFASARATPRGG
ncbi:MAG: GntG family PLP-dependent aldolase [Thermodesulfobacteriota bacterium]